MKTSFKFALMGLVFGILFYWFLYAIGSQMFGSAADSSFLGILVVIFVAIPKLLTGISYIGIIFSGIVFFVLGGIIGFITSLIKK